MSFGTVIVAIVAMLVIAQLLRERRSASRDDATAGMEAAREEQLEAEIEELRERIKVLERIAYEDTRRVGLADEIERLRD